MFDDNQFDQLATRIFGVDDPRQNLMMRYFLIGACSRILRPGCQMDSMLVLVGPQGVGKSTFVRDMFGKQFVRSQMPALDNKDASLALSGFWAIEIAELDRILRAENSTVKEFLTRTYDDYRAPYERCDMRHPRKCVFVGTTNENDFLRDVTGARRFWPIQVQNIDLTYVRDNQKAILKHAFRLARANERYWFEDDSVLNDLRQPLEEVDIWTAHVERYLKDKTQVNLEDVYTKAISLGGIGSATRGEARRLGNILRRLGWSKKKTNAGNVWVK